MLQPLKMKAPEFLEALRQWKPDVVAVTAFGRILPPAILALPPRGCINVHGSLLPKYRGAGPVQWAVIRGERETGITTMMMDEGMDTGDMLLQERVVIRSRRYCRHACVAAGAKWADGCWWTHYASSRQGRSTLNHRTLHWRPWRPYSRKRMA